MTKVKYVSFHSKRNFGVEMEMNQKLSIAEIVKIVAKKDSSHHVHHSTSYQQDYNNNFWHVKFDRSCGDIKDQGGWEVASYKGSGPKDVLLFGEMADALCAGGAAVNDDCALHIHVEVNDFNIEKISTLVAYWMKIEDMVCEMLPKHRRNNKYCKLLTKKYPVDIYKKYTPATLWELVRPKRQDKFTRRVSLNLCNYGNNPARCTIELRLPEFVLNGKDVKNWIRFIVHFVDVVKKKKFPENMEPVGLKEAMTITGLHGGDNFFILSKGLRDVKIWFMNRILLYSGKRSVRNEAEDFLSDLGVTQRPNLSNKYFIL